MKTIFAFMVCIGLSASAATTNCYVATTGSDSTGDGSIGNPWATVQKAVNMTSHHGAADYSDQKIVWVRGGNYYNQTVLLTQFDHANFLIASYGSETAVLYGGQLLTGWVGAGSNGWYAASLGTFPTIDTSTGRETTWEPRALLANGAWVPRAKDPGPGAKYAYTSFSGTALVYTNVFPASTNGEIQSDCGWTDTELNITAINTGTKTITTSAAMTRNGGNCDNVTSFTMLNTPAGMTLSEQFWWNKTNNTIVYAGTDPSVKTMIVPTVSRIFYLQGFGAGSEITNIVISNLTVACTTAPINDGSKDDVATFYYPAIDFKITTNCALKNCTVHGCAGKGVGSDNYNGNFASDGLIISGNTIHDMGASAVGLEGVNNETISNNSIYNCGLNCQAGTGITGYKGATISGNTISNTVGAGIWVPTPSGFSDGVKIWTNKVLGCAQQLRDYGAIYTIMTSNLNLVGNVVAYTPSAQSNFFNLTPLDSSTTNWNGLHGIYLDFGTTKAFVSNNIVFDCDDPLIHHAGSNNVVKNNYFINRRLGGKTEINIHNSTNSPPQFTNNIYYVSSGVPYINAEDSNYVPYNWNTNAAVVSWVGSITYSASGNNNFNPTNATSSDPQFKSLVYPKRLGFSGTTASALGIQPLTFFDDALSTVSLGWATIGNAKFQ